MLGATAIFALYSFGVVAPSTLFWALVTVGLFFLMARESNAAVIIGDHRWPRDVARIPQR